MATPGEDNPGRARHKLRRQCTSTSGPVLVAP
jgi:hypothetical protein